MYFSNRLWYLQSEVLYILSSHHSKSYPLTLFYRGFDNYIFFFLHETQRFSNENHDALLHVVTHFNTTDFQTHHNHHLDIMTMTPI